MKKTLFILLTLLAALLVFVSCDGSLDADVFNTTPDVEPVDPKSVPLTLEFPTTGTVTITKEGNPGSIKYSLNGGEKTEAVSGISIEVPANGTISFYRTLDTVLNDSNYFTISCTADCYVYGNIMSLVDSVNYATETTVPAFAFFQLFESNVNVDINPEKGELVLPATTLATSCYESMFSGCTSLATAPTLPATTLADSCYLGMFYGCSSLTTAPTLPATSLADKCYEYMFSYCSSLTTAPTLPATTLADFCYAFMFSYCSSLNSITCLATNISATNCTYYWVSGVAGTGTFKRAAGTDAAWIEKTGTDGIPSGWTVDPALDL